MQIHKITNLRHEQKTCENGKSNVWLVFVEIHIKYVQCILYIATNGVPSDTFLMCIELCIAMLCHNMCARAAELQCMFMLVFIFSIVHRGSIKPFFSCSIMTWTNFSMTVQAHSLALNFFFCCSLWLRVYVQFCSYVDYTYNRMLVGLPGFPIFKLRCIFLYFVHALTTQENLHTLFEHTSHSLRDLAMCISCINLRVLLTMLWHPVYNFRLVWR